MKNSNTNNSNSNENNGGTSSTVMAQCEDCGRRLPGANMAIHRATCRVHRVEHSPTTRREEEEAEQRGEGLVDVDSNSGETIATAQHPPATTRDVTSPSTTATATSTAAPITPAAVPENHWACPRCTLHNQISSNTCDACLYQRGSQQQQNNNALNANNNNNITNQGMHVNITEVDPRVVGTAVNVASWSLFGAMVGGPVGAVFAGGAAAAVDGLRRQQRRQRATATTTNNSNNTGRRPFFTFTTTSYTTTPWGGTSMSVTSNASGQRRTMTIRDAGVGQGGQHIRLNQMSPTDRHILQMLMSNAVRLGAATPETANQMSFEELLQQFGFPDAADYDLNRRRRGAAPELIDQCSSLQNLDTKQAIEELTDNQSVCNICLEELKQGDEMRKLDYCSHTFHKECIDRWLTQVASCPICKHELNSEQQHRQQENNEGG